MSIKNSSLVAELKEAIADVDHKPKIVVGDEGTVEVTYIFQLVRTLLFSLSSTVFSYFVISMVRLHDIRRLSQL